MNSFQSFLKFSIGTGVSAVISLVTIPVITWFISPEELGKGTMFTLAFNLLINVFLSGLDQGFARHFHEHPEATRPKLLSAGFYPAMIFTGAGSVLILVFSDWLAFILFSDERHAPYAALLSVALFCGVGLRFGLLLIRMQQKAVTYSVIQILMVALNLGFTLAYALWVVADFRAIVVGFAASQFISVLITFAIESSTWRQTLVVRPARAAIRAQMSYGLPFVPTFLFDWIFQSTDRTLLRIYSTFSQIGIYATATRISGSLNLLQTGFNTFWTPFVFERHTKDPDNKGYYGPIFEALYVTFAFAITALLLGKELLFLIIAAQYHESISLFPLLLFVPMLYTLSEVSGVGINLKKRTIIHLYIVIISATVSLITGYLLIPGFGAKGAIMSSFLSYLVFFTLRSSWGNALYPLPLNWIKFLITFTAVFIPAAYSFLFPEKNQYVLLTVLLAVLYFRHAPLISDLLKRIKLINQN